MGTGRDITCVKVSFSSFCIKHTPFNLQLSRVVVTPENGSALYIVEPVGLLLAHIIQPLVSSHRTNGER
jgi:hypothetical protein